MDPEPPSTISVTVGAPAWRTHLAGPKAVCRRAAGAALARVPIPPWLARAEVSILLADDATVRRLNAAHRGQDRATDVLSFPAFDRIPEAAPGHLPPGPVPLGDVVLALETVRAEAEAGAKSLADHVSHLVVHGCLHLLGYDHQDADDAERMEAMERPILERLGIADPYAGRSRGERRASPAASRAWRFTMKELPAGGREGQASLLAGLLTRLRVLARRRNGEGHSLRETLEELIEEDEDETQDRAEFTEQERELLLNALSFGELQVWDVMVPRSDIQAIEITAGLAEVVGTMRNAMHTRLPVYRGNLDDVIGMVHIKDLLPYWGDGAEFKLEPIVREVLFVPPSMRVLDLLLQMRDTGVHMAIVVDEYGGTDGLATIEDLVEEIVGEIQDEHDKILPPQIVELPNGALEADARVEVEELERRLGLELLDAERREDVDTLGGLLFTLLDRVPARGEIVRHPAGLEFAVLDADPRRIKRLRIMRQAQPAASEETLSARARPRLRRWTGG